MKRFLREPWIAIALIWFLGAFALSFFATYVGGVIGKGEAYWFVQIEGGSIRIAAGEGFGWIFQFGAESNFTGLENWTLSQLFPVPKLIAPDSFYREFSLTIPQWIPVVGFAAVGLTLKWVRTNRVRSANR